jgi:hypothetical protein
MVTRASICQKCGMEIWLDGKHKCDRTGFDDGPQPREKHQTITPPPSRLPPEPEKELPPDVVDKAKKNKPILLSDVKRLVLKKGDTIVLKSNEKLSPGALEYLKNQMKSIYPSQQTLILDEGFDIGVLVIK